MNRPKAKLMALRQAATRWYTGSQTTMILRDNAAKTETTATGLPLAVPSIRSSEVGRTQRSGVRHCEDALQAFDFGNSLLGVHPSQYPAWVWQSSNGAAC